MSREEFAKWFEEIQIQEGADYKGCFDCRKDQGGEDGESEQV